MFNLNKKYLLMLLSLSAVNFSLIAQEYCCDEPCNRFYIGGFGGGIYSNSNEIIQTGVAFFPEFIPTPLGGPLAVDARGHSNRTSSGFGGVQIGYEWTQCPIQFGCSDWSLTPGVELEAYFYSHTKKGELINPTTRLPEHDFLVSLPMNMGVYLINGVVSLNSCCLCNFTPYVGAGIGPARINVRHAKSEQIAPPEVGVNHFDSRTHDSAWAFAAQAKAGLRYNICNGIHIFGEYRFLFVDSSSYLFGATTAAGHVPTTTWDVQIENILYNAFAFGIQIDL